MPKSLKNFTLRHLLISILGVIAIWAASFYWILNQQVNASIDDGLRRSKNRIILTAKTHPEILNTHQFGIGQFKITPLPKGTYSSVSQIYNIEIFIDEKVNSEPVRMLQSVFFSNRNFYKSEIYASTIEDDQFLQNLLVALCFLYVALVISVLVINKIVLEKAWSLFYNILDKLQEYRIDNQNQLLESDSKIKEFIQLENELIRMIKRNEIIFEHQKQFIGNASHEIQTPLAIASNKLELMLEEKEMNGNLSKKLMEVNSILNRMKRLNKSLLMMTKIENQQFSDVKSINFNKLIHTTLEELNELKDYKNDEITLQERAPFNFTMNAELAQVLLTNLIKNALLHSPENAHLFIEITDSKIEFRNPGNAALPKDELFDRFYKEQQKEHSTGLGLAIVNSIINLYPNLSIEYDFKDQHIFQLKKEIEKIDFIY